MEARRSTSEAIASASAVPDPGDPVALGTEHQAVHRGTVWMLTEGSDPDKPESWIERSMWLTVAGGLFHEGDGDKDGQHDPCGCIIEGFLMRPIQQKQGDRFAFELGPPGHTGASGTGNTTGTAMVLAVNTEEERSAWLRNLSFFEGSVVGSRPWNGLLPLDIYNRRGGRRRSGSDMGDGVVRTPSMSSSAPAFSSPAMRPSEPPTSPSPESSDVSDLGEEDEEEVSPKLSSAQRRGVLQYQRIRRNSQSQYAEKLHTVLLLDWDDTLFPTTWVRRDCALNWRLALDAQLKPGPRMTLITSLLDKLLDKSLDFFEEASKHANIFIVTLARRPWVEISMQNFLPKLAKVIHGMELKVIYAQEYVDELMSRRFSADDFRSAEESKQFWTLVKGEAIAREVDQLHKKNDTSWKNIISLGDSDYERYGTITAGEDYMKREMRGSKVIRTGFSADGALHTCEGVSTDGHLKKLRMKTVKMLSEPTIEELTAELNLLTSWLPHMVQKESGFDIELDGSDDNERLSELHRQVTGEKVELTWEELAGMK